MNFIICVAPPTLIPIKFPLNNKAAFSPKIELHNLPLRIVPKFLSCLKQFHENFEQAPISHKNCFKSDTNFGKDLLITLLDLGFFIFINPKEDSTIQGSN